MDDYRRNHYYLDGNAARELPGSNGYAPDAVPERDYEPSRESERITRRQQQAGQQVHPRKAPAREPQVVSLSAVAGFLLVAVLAVSVLTTNIRLNSVCSQVVAQQKALVQLEGEYSKLAAADEQIFDNESLKKVAEQAGLVKPQMGQQVYLELSDPNNTVVYSSPEKATGLAGVVEWFKGLFGLAA